MGERDQLLTILQCISDARWGWGRVTLIRILRGDLNTRRKRSPLRPEARAQAQFGLLAFRSETAIGKLIDRLSTLSFVCERRLDNGGTVLELTQAGRAALAHPGELDPLVTQPGPPPRDRSRDKTKSSAVGADSQLDLDPNLLAKLRAWQKAQAKEQGVPPYFVLNRATIRALAVQRPTTLEELEQIKGIGPRRLETYGAALIEIIRSHRKADSPIS
jgi:ATP-dependent DNA helicase RecQ